MAFSVAELPTVLGIMGMGMIGIFVVIGLIMAVIIALNKFTADKE